MHSLAKFALIFLLIFTLFHVYLLARNLSVIENELPREIKKKLNTIENYAQEPKMIPFKQQLANIPVKQQLANIPVKQQLANIPVEQQPVDCSKTIHFEFTGGTGFGSEINNLLNVFLFADHFHRQVTLDDKEWNYGQWHMIFKNKSASFLQGCAPQKDDLAFEWDIKNPEFHAAHPHLSVNRYTWHPILHWVMGLGTIENQFREKQRIALEVWKPISCILNQALNVLVSISKNEGREHDFNACSEKEAALETEIPFVFPEPFLAVHIRRGDKLLSEAKEQKMDIYVEALESLFRVHNITAHYRLFAISDDSRAILELQKLKPFWTITRIKSSLSGHDQDSHNNLAPDVRQRLAQQLVFELEIAKRAKGVVCAMASNVCRLIATIRESQVFEAGVKSIDGNWDVW